MRVVACALLVDRLEERRMRKEHGKGRARALEQAKQRGDPFDFLGLEFGVGLALALPPPRPRDADVLARRECEDERRAFYKFEQRVIAPSARGSDDRELARALQTHTSRGVCREVCIAMDSDIFTLPPSHRSTKRIKKAHDASAGRHLAALRF